MAVGYQVVSRLMILLSIFAATGREGGEAPPLEVVSGTDEYRPHGSMEYFVDKGGTITFDKLLASNFVPLASRPSNLSFLPADAAAWLRLCLKNRDHPREQWIVGFDAAALSSVELFRPLGNGELLHQRNGTRVPLRERAIASHFIAFPIDLKRSESTCLYFRVQSLASVEASLSLSTPEVFAVHADTVTGLLNFYFGYFTALFLFNLLLFLSAPDRNYFYYLAVEVTVGTAFWIGTGMSDFYLSQWVTETQRVFAPIGTLGVGLMFLFARHFLHLPRMMPRVDKLLRITQWLVFASIPLALFNPSLLAGITNIWAVLLAPIFLPVSLYAWRKGFPSAGLFLVGWASTLLSLVVWFLDIGLGWIPHSLWSFNAPLIGNALEMLFFAFALSDRVNVLRDELVRAQVAKATALGEMAGGVAHEINSPLTVISGLAVQIQRIARAPNRDGEEIVTRAGKIEGTVQRIATIVRGLRWFSRDALGEPLATVLVKSIVERTLELCLQEFKDSSIELLVDPISAQLTISCRDVQVSQALLNLLINAREAAQKVERKWVRISVAEAGSYVELAVSDSGLGVDEKLHDRIMQPFFTTKDVGKGAGLGLSVAKGIVEAHVGELRLDVSSPHTRFVMRLPKEH